MVNIVKDLSVEHVLMFVIVAFLLYHLIGGCSCDMLRRDGFNVGGQPECDDALEKLDEICCDNDNCPDDYPIKCNASCNNHIQKILTSCSNTPAIKTNMCRSCGAPENCNDLMCTPKDPFNNTKLKTAVRDWLLNQAGAEKTYGPINCWDTSKVTDMSGMFYGADAFNGDISGWDTSSVIDMNRMFDEAKSFKGDISKWNTGRVTDMSYMFSRATLFNSNLSSWDTSSVIDMSGMFSGAASFDGDISSWKTGKVTDMSSMFNMAVSFKGDISLWDTSKVTRMSLMFRETTSFNCEKIDSKKSTRLYAQCIIDKS